MTVPLVVGFDGALGSFSVALVAGERAFVRVAEGNSSLERGLVLLDELLTEARLTPDGIDAFACGVGPGAFTGLRITLSYAKSIAFATGRPLAGISSFALLADRAEEPVPPLVVVRPRAGVFCARLTANGAAHEMTGTAADVATACIEADLGTAPSAVVFPATCAADLHAAGLAVDAVPLRDEAPALTVARMLRRRLLAGEHLPVSPHSVRANYGEAPATTAPVLAG